MDRSPVRHRRLNPRRLRGQLVVLAVVMWAVVAFEMATPTWFLRSGQVKGTDFVHFYTLARLAADGRVDRFADLEAQRQVQLEVRPESANDWYPPAYGPQVSILLGPLGHLSYGAALLAWLTVTAAAYLGLMALTIRPSTRIRPHAGLALLAAVAFPPFWELILHGQLSIVSLAALTLAWLAFRKGRAGWAGLALGVLAYKPSLAAPVFALIVCAAEWRVARGMVLGALAHAAAAVLWVGAGGLQSYVDVLLNSPRLAVLLSFKPDQMHSWRAFWMLLIPDRTTAAVLYVVSAAITLVVAGRLWRQLSDVNLRMAVLVIATTLASPHLYVYDLVILAPVWIWLTDWYLDQPSVPPIVGRTLYVGYALPLLSAAFTRFARVQLFTLCLTVLLLWLWRHALARQEPAIETLNAAVPVAST